MRKNFVKTFLICLCTACISMGAAVSFTKNSPSAHAQETEQTITQENANSLLLPERYEQYLPLVSPSDVAVSERYKAVADGKFIYVYNEKTESYSCYEHDLDVTELQFSGNTLYFLDKEPRLYKLNAENPSVVEATSLSCSAFTIDSDVIYYLTFSGGFSKITPANLQTLTPDPQKAQDNLPSTPAPAMATYNGNLYYTCEQKKSYLYNLHDEQLSMLLSQSTIRSLAIEDGILYYTDAKGDFYAYDFISLRQDVTTSPLFEPIAGCSAIAAGEDGYIYLVQGSSIRQYSPQTKALTDYEICASSASENRLSGATDLILTEQTVYVADKGNARISAYNPIDGERNLYKISDGAQWLASDGKTALCADETAISLVDLSSGETLCAFDSPTHFSGNVVGVTRVFDVYYFLTSANYFYRLTQDEQGGYYLEGAPKTSAAPKLLTSDVYGNLYVAYSDNKVYRFTESEFCDGAATGVVQTTILSNSEKLAVDYGGNLYALANGEIFKYEKQPDGYGAEEKIDLSERYVYGGKDYTPKLTSFAFSIEDNVAYLLYDGNYLVQTDKFQLPTMKNIAVNGADESIFANESAVFQVVKTNKRALLVEFDLEQLQGAAYFPYLSYERSEEETTALKIGETETYDVIAVFDKAVNGYSTYLVRKEFVTALLPEEYQTEYEEEKTGYLTNNITLYKFPYLCALLTAKEEKLPRTATVQILGEINELDHAYYHVSYTNEDGETHTGYIPKAYVSFFDGAPPESDSYLAGATSSDQDAVGRLVYILLGLAAICLLTDFLLLRKKKDEEK